MCVYLLPLQRAGADSSAGGEGVRWVWVRVQRWM